MMRKLTKYGADFLVRREERGVAYGTGGPWDVADVGGFLDSVYFFVSRKGAKGAEFFIINVITGITLIFLVILVIRGDI